MAFFGNIDEQKEIIIKEETTADGLTVRHFKHGNLNIRTTSNKPSEKALKRAAAHVDKEYKT